ncbi:hypothetical protein Misp01_10900 [Microtetraspora sp. NBRC 13810]|nr:hypothetical protein Misp01_10900 [Microtetraspora sp. NBRC 13810]
MVYLISTDTPSVGKTARGGGGDGEPGDDGGHPKELSAKHIIMVMYGGLGEQLPLSRVEDAR